MVWLPRSSGPVLQHPSRKNPVTGSIPHDSRSPPSTLRSLTAGSIPGRSVDPPGRHTALPTIRWMTDGCETGLCGSDVPPLVGRVLTGTGLTLDQAAERLVDDEPLPALTPIQRRLVEEHAARL